MVVYNSTRTCHDHSDVQPSSIPVTGSLNDLNIYISSCYTTPVKVCSRFQLRLLLVIGSIKIPQKTMRFAISTACLTLVVVFGTLSGQAWSLSCLECPKSCDCLPNDLCDCGDVPDRATQCSINCHKELHETDQRLYGGRKESRDFILSSITDRQTQVSLATPPQ